MPMHNFNAFALQNVHSHLWIILMVSVVYIWIEYPDHTIESQWKMFDKLIGCSHTSICLFIVEGFPGNSLVVFGTRYDSENVCIRRAGCSLVLYFCVYRQGCSLVRFHANSHCLCARFLSVFRFLLTLQRKFRIIFKNGANDHTHK